MIQYQIGDGQWTDLNDNFTNLPKYKDCGTTVIKVRVVNNGNVGPAVEAKISITQRKITLTSAKDEKFYDGTPLTNDTIVVGGEDEFVEGEGIASYLSLIHIWSDLHHSWYDMRYAYWRY